MGEGSFLFGSSTSSSDEPSISSSLSDSLLSRKEVTWLAKCDRI